VTTRADVEDFLASERIAVVGVSRSGKRFGNAAYRALKARGYEVIAVHPQATQIEGDACVASLAAIAPPVDGVLIVVPPRETERVVRDAESAGINRVWMQQGSQSDAAVAFCHEHGMRVVANECILMFARPTGLLHRAHRWLVGAVGRLPH
jgi:hypothetical protein